MIKINKQKIKELIENKKKLALQKALPFILATGFIFGAGATKAEAANVEFPTISITNDEYVNEGSYKSNYVTDRQARELNEIIEDIDNDFQNVYTILANGGMNIGHTGQKTNSMARMLASINSIETEYENVMNSLNSTEKQIIQKYLESKINESKLVFSSITNISVKELNDYDYNYNCEFVSSSNNLINISVYKIQNNQVTDLRVITLNDSNLSNSNTLVVIPSLVTIYNNSKPTFKTEYNALIIPKNNEAMCLQAMGDIDLFYNKIEQAIDAGNYTNSSSNDIILSIYGDTNLISETINNKYAYYTNLSTALNQYLSYKQSLMVSKVYNKNSNRIDYNDFIEYSMNNKPIRIGESQGFVSYKNGNDILLTVDRGYLDTSDLQSKVTPSNPNQLKNVKFEANTGVNIYVDGNLFIPRDVNGNRVLTFLYNGTTYLPARAISTLYGANIEWKNNAIYITSGNTATDSYYYDEYGNKVYIQNYPDVPFTNESPSYKLTKTQLTGYSGVKVYVDGQQIIPRDVTGKEVDVFIINGTTYLPARAISNIFGASINWNQETNSAILNRNSFTINNGNNIIIDDGFNDIIIDDNNNGNMDGAYYYDEYGNKIYIAEDEYEHNR